ncbi:MAG: transporter substrate-binding domain-containing protein [Halioglobus sp.]|nr:transporter substrate-binding domain-containing protein [Halieaceae bacterium]MDG2410786.1 transporter substrate-binding domain-containing protein [Halioglobus sp.]
MFNHSVSRYISTLVLAVICAGGVRAEESVRLLANTSPPYAGASLPDQGLALELVRHIFTRTDYTPEITIENWSRAVEGARIGVYDALASVWYSPEREEDLLFSKPYLESDLILLKLRSNRRPYTSLDDLAGGRLGVRKDYAYGVDFDGIPNLVQVEEDLLVSNLLNLLDGKVDFVIADQRTATMQLHELLNDKINQVEVMGIALPVVKRHIAAARAWPGHEAMIAAFDRALVSTQDDGSLQRIITEWNERYTNVK